MSKSKVEWTFRFKQEAARHLETMEYKLRLQLETALRSSTESMTEFELENLHELFRLAHTIKGSAAMVGQLEISQLAFQLEHLFSNYYKAEKRFSNLEYDTFNILIGQLQFKLEQIGSANT